MAAGACRCRSCITRCPRSWRSSAARGPDSRSSAPIRRRSRTYSSRSPGDSFGMSSRRSWRDHALVQLTLVRYREFYREPEALFWVFIFPVLLTAGLGIAFRSGAPERIPVALVARAGADDALARGLAATAGIRVRRLDDSAAARAIRT